MLEILGLGEQKPIEQCNTKTPLQNWERGRSEGQTCVFPISNSSTKLPGRQCFLLLDGSLLAAVEGYLVIDCIDNDRVPIFKLTR